MQPFPLLLSVATGIRTMMYCKNDGLRDYQQEMKLRLFKEWEFHRSVMVQMPTGTGKTHLLAAVVKEFLCGIGIRHAGVDCGASQRAGGADRGNRSPVWNGQRTGQNGKERKDGERQYAGRIRKGAGILHPVVVTKLGRSIGRSARI